MKPLSTWRATIKLIAFHPQSYIAFSLLYLFSFGSQLIPGLIVQEIFDRLSGGAPAAVGMPGLLALLAGVGLARILADTIRVPSEETFRCYGWALLRKNILQNMLRRPGASPLPVPPGDALNRLSSDVMELADWPSWLPFITGRILFALSAMIIMLTINVPITLVILLPLVAIVVIVQVSWKRLLRYEDAGRSATSRVTAFLGEALDAVQAVKVADAEMDVTNHLHQLGESRRQAQVRLSVLHGILDWAHSNVADLGLGIILLLAAQAMQPGPGGTPAFTVGNLTLFITYLSLIVDFLATVGSFISDYQTQSISIRRLSELQPQAAPEALVEHGPVYLHGPFPPIPDPAPADADRLEALTVRGLTYAHPGSNRGIQDISLDLPRGSFTVVTGRVGAGKTTLLRVLLGLLPGDGGQILWNGRPVDDPQTFFVPPRCAYAPQVPYLFSESLRDNILMGLEREPAALQAAVHAAVLERDVAELDKGLDTLIGPRGIRLSGGQAQRTAAARMFVRTPELLVIDDMSSALDVETERILWERLSVRQDPETGPTCLVVSHRRPVLRRADQILVIQEGRLVAAGRLVELLESCPEMQRLWQGEVDPAG